MAAAKERRTAQQIQQHLQDAIDALPACQGARLTMTVQRIEADDWPPGAWTVEIQATGKPLDRDRCEAAAMQIVADAINRFDLVLDA